MVKYPWAFALEPQSLKFFFNLNLFNWRLRKLWYIYTMEYYSAIKKNTFESVLWPFELESCFLCFEMNVLEDKQFQKSFNQNLKSMGKRKDINTKES